MTRRHRARNATAAPPPPPSAAGGAAAHPELRAIFTVICLLVAVLAVGLVWAQPRPIGDLYVALVGGQEVLQGKLGGLDEWSFVTTDRVWINQNWGMHLITYLSYLAAGETGVLVFKALLMLCMAGGMVLSARERGAAWTVALVVTGALVLGSKAYLDIRPNLVSLAFSPVMLWLLYRTRRGCQGAWWALAWAVLWANMHGGFVFGLGMLGLWALCRVVPRILSEKSLRVLRERWPLAASALAAVVLAAALSPFGLENLTHARQVSHPKWREVSEWQPVLGPIQARGATGQTLEELARYLVTWKSERGAQIPFGSLWEFAAALDVLLVLWLLRRLAWLRALAQDRARPGDITADKAGVAVFELVVAGLVIVMAFKARRFIPLAMVMLAPILASQLSWLVARRRWRGWPQLVAPLAAGIALTLAVSGYARGLLLHYDPENPLHDHETLLQRMVLFGEMFPPGAAQFINENGISGRVFQEWRWEGYLRWRCPQLKLHVGGRAQQVYRLEDFQVRAGLLEGTLPARRTLEAMDVHLVIVPPRRVYGELLSELAFGPQGTWAPIYMDGWATVLADTRHPPTAALVEAALRGGLRYPAQDIELASRAMCMQSRPVLERTEQREQVEMLRRAVALRPRPELYQRMPEARMPSGTPLAPEQAAYLRSEFDRLGNMDENKARGLLVVMCRELLARYLAEHYSALGDRVTASAWAALARELRDRKAQMEQLWRDP